MQFFVKRILTYTHTLLTLLDTLDIGVFPVISRDLSRTEAPDMQRTVLIVPMSIRATKTVPYILSTVTPIEKTRTVAGVFRPLLQRDL